MNPLPQLRTVHTRPPQSGAAETVAAQPSDAVTRFGHSTDLVQPQPGVDLSRVPLPARGLLCTLHAHGLLTDQHLTRFLRDLGDRVRKLVSREVAADALVHFGLISKYVRGRALAGHFSGLVFGPYRVLDRAGAGSVGVVFVGEHAVIGRRVAIKVLTTGPAENPEICERFLGEARALAAVDHPHVVGVHDAGVSRSGGDEYWYMVQEWAGGGDLEAVVYDRGVAGVAMGCRWGWQAAAGLDAAHRAGLVHRDVKPSNLLLDHAGRVKVADFGLARGYEVDRTPVNAVVGSLQFLAPEQLNDPTSSGPPADVYGLAVTLFWVISGKLPYPDGKPSEMVVQLRTKPPERLKRVFADTPAELDDLFARMMARNPSDRPTLPQAMAVFARYAAPTGVPEVAALVLPQDDADETDTLRAAVDQLEHQLSEACRHRDEARRAVLTALHAVQLVRPDGGYERGERVRAYTAVLARHLGEHPHWSGYRSPGVQAELAAVAAACEFGRLGLTPVDTGSSAHPAKAPDDHRRASPLAVSVIDKLAELSTSLPFLRIARDAVKHLHERWDGNGWPEGLKQTAIPPVARVIAVAAALDRLMSRPRADFDLAMVDLIRQAGSAFDPDVISALKTSAEELRELATPVFKAELIADEPLPSGLPER